MFDNDMNNNTIHPPVKDAEIIMKIYNEINTNIRFTDEISFKLLGLVPFVSSLGILGLSMSDLTQSPVAALISIFAAIVTSALFIWEIRNMQICKWWIERLVKIESENAWIMFGCKSRPEGHGRIVRKTVAQYLIYSITISSWIMFAIIILSDLSRI